MRDIPQLFRPLVLRGIQTRNRVVISPMCQYSAHEGHMDDWHLVHLGRFAIGGAGMEQLANMGANRARIPSMSLNQLNRSVSTNPQQV